MRRGRTVNNFQETSPHHRSFHLEQSCDHANVLMRSAPVPCGQSAPVDRSSHSVTDSRLVSDKIPETEKGAFQRTFLLRNVPMGKITRRPWLLELIVGLGAAVIAVCLVVGSLAASLALHHPLVAFALPILAVVLSLLIAQSLSSTTCDTQDDPFTVHFQRIWRLRDPSLGNASLWRTDFDSATLNLTDLDDPQLMRPTIDRLIDDWSIRIGYPYDHCPVVRVLEVGTARPHRSRSSNVRPRWYRVTIEPRGDEPGERKLRETGLLCISPDHAEFQLVPPTRPHRRALTVRRDSDKFSLHDVEPITRFRASARPADHTMWDRWLDG
jgi:hypothetical protein